MILKIFITLEFKEKLWCDKNLEDKRKIRYYKEVINPNIEYQNYLSILTSEKKKIHIAIIRMNSHELHNETRHWTFPKTSWDERICHLCEIMSVNDEKKIHLDCLVYTHIGSQFQIFCYNTNLFSLLSH